MTGADLSLGYVKCDRKMGPSLRQELDTIYQRELVKVGINYFARRDTSASSKIINFELITTKQQVLLPHSFRLPVLEDYRNRASWK